MKIKIIKYDRNERTEIGKKNLKMLLSILLFSYSIFVAFTLPKSKQVLGFMKEKMQFFFTCLKKKNEP